MKQNDRAPNPPPSARTTAGGKLPYLNREVSWLAFNERVLGEALDASNPLLERVNFLSIFGSNLDEFFMIRVSGLRRQMQASAVAAPPDGMTPAEQLLAIREKLVPLLAAANRAWRKDLLPALREEGIRILRYEELKQKQRKLLRKYFISEIFPVLTPLAFDPGHPFPHISNLSINLAVVVREKGHGDRFARVKVPQSIPRLLRIPDEERAGALERLGLDEVRAPNFVLLEELIAANLDQLFPGVEVVAAHPFRITRDADMDIEEDEAADLMSAMSDFVEQRRFGNVVRLQINDGMPRHIEEILVQNLQIARFQVYRTPGPVGLSELRSLSKVDRPEHKFPPFMPRVQFALSGEERIFSVLQRQDILLFHPYDSFLPVVRFVREAAEDPEVLTIKMTLYRVGPNSPIVDALMQARENGKQVAVLVELKARFDEENNITWARTLERAGVHVAYGLVGLKTHAKLCLVVRRQQDGIRTAVHLATGNYNPITARIYTDIGFFTADKDIASDASDLFNALTGISRKSKYRKLLVAPSGMRDGLIERIEREVTRHRKHGDGRIVFKCNSLTDRAIIAALYDASRAGVEISLQVRGICCLQPEVAKQSETITVTSIVGRFLEHSRIYYFRNGGDEEILTGSADLMSRNLDRRVEILFPIEEDSLRDAIRDVLFRHLADTSKSHRLRSDGTYVKTRSKSGDGESAQQYLVDQGGSWRR